MRESDIEKKLKDRVKNFGGMAVKFVSPSFNGMPDRFVLLPSGHIAFIELKAPNKKLRPLQAKRKKALLQNVSIGYEIHYIHKLHNKALHEIKVPEFPES